MSDVSSVPLFVAAVHVSFFVARVEIQVGVLRLHWGVSVENLPRRGFGATCCACVSFALEIAYQALVPTTSKRRLRKLLLSKYRTSPNNSRGDDMIISLFASKRGDYSREAVISNIAHLKSCPKYFVLLSHEIKKFSHQIN